jgi:hypothetical protein
VAREVAIACEDLVQGTVTAVDASGVTVTYKLDDGSDVTVRRWPSCCGAARRGLEAQARAAHT